MPATKDELTERAQLVRVHEANCKIEYPTAEESNFRIAVMKKLGVSWGLRELRAVVIGGPVIQNQPRPNNPKK